MTRAQRLVNKMTAARRARAADRAEREVAKALVLGDFGRGDRVRLEDGRIIELGWPSWPFTVKKKEQERVPPDRWFCREIVEDWDGPIRVDLDRMLRADTRVAEVILQKQHSLGELNNDGGRGGGDIDPMLGDRSGGLL